MGGKSAVRVHFWYEPAWVMIAFSLSLPLCVADRQSGYVYVLALFLLGHGFVVYSLFIVANMAVCLAIFFG